MFLHVAIFQSVLIRRPRINFG